MDMWEAKYGGYGNDNWKLDKTNKSLFSRIIKYFKELLK